MLIKYVGHLQVLNEEEKEIAALARVPSYLFQPVFVEVVVADIAIMRSRRSKTGVIVVWW